jgi:arsenite/tail-anchored protein-transporting ATPase
VPDLADPGDYAPGVRIVLFTGKGGVGKTTLAAATAAHLARSGRKTLVVSTDAAHSLGDALEAQLGGEPSEVDGGLFAAHVDTRALLDGSWGRLQEHLRTLLAGAGVDELAADELTVLPGVEELLALGAVRRVAETGPWDVVVVDCGPTADTLRLLALPEAVSGYLERLFPAHRRAVRGLAGLAAGGTRQERAESALRWDRTADALDALATELVGLRALLSAGRTSVRLVLTPERVVAAETRRTLTALALHGLHVDGMVANRVVPMPSSRAAGPAASWLRERGAEQAAVLADLAGLGVPVRTVEYAAAEPTGVAALLELADGLWAGHIQGGDDPAADPGPVAPLMALRRTAGSGTSAESEFELTLHLPGAGAGALDLARVGDELVVTAAGARRLVALPAVLRRCTVTRARLDGDDLRVTFRPDPAVWLR